MSGINQTADKVSVVERFATAQETAPGVGQVGRVYPGSSTANDAPIAGRGPSNAIRSFLEAQSDSPFAHSTPTLAGAAARSVIDWCSSSTTSTAPYVTDTFNSMRLSSSVLIDDHFAIPPGGITWEHMARGLGELRVVGSTDHSAAHNGSWTWDDLTRGLGQARIADGVVVQSRRRRARRFAAERLRTQINAHLDEARRSTASRRAYESFERAVDLFVANESASPAFAPFVSYLGDDSAPYRDTLLSCLADQDVRLVDASAVSKVSALLADSNRELARSAALTLAGGGDTASEALHQALMNLERSRRADLERLLAFAIP